MHRRHRVRQCCGALPGIFRIRQRRGDLLVFGRRRAPMDSVHLRQRAGGDAISAPSSFELQYWNGAAWVTTIRRRYESFLAGQSRTYSASHPTVARQAWRIYTTATQTGNPGICTLQLRSALGGSNVATGGTPSTSSCFTAGYMGDQAFDANSATLWISGAAAPQWLSYKFASATDIVQYLITVGGGEQARHPKTFKLQYEDGNGNWLDADSRVNEANWINGETRTYSLTPVASARPVVFACT
jgi:hypothetical protein